MTSKGILLILWTRDGNYEGFSGFLAWSETVSHALLVAWVTIGAR